MLTSGTYAFNVTIIPSSSNQTVSYAVNGTTVGSVPDGASGNPATITRILSLIAGDTLEVTNTSGPLNSIGAGFTLELIRIA